MTVRSCSEFAARFVPSARPPLAYENGVSSFESADFLPYDEAAATWHGHERARLERLGQSAPCIGGQIAAITHVHRLVLVTANTKDFTRFKGLEVVDWTRTARRRKGRQSTIP